MQSLSLSIKSAFLNLIVWLLFMSITAAKGLPTGNPDFTGTWVLNIAKSDFGRTPNRAAVKKFIISQRKDSILIQKSTVNSKNEDITSTEAISFDGKTCSQLLDSKRTRASKISWSSDGKLMTIKNIYSVPSNPNLIDYELSQTWVLSDNGQELIVVLTSPTYTFKAVYDKQ